ncbi:unnamed protein product, partial [Brassica oleracea var. botrytis]
MIHFSRVREWDLVQLVLIKFRVLIMEIFNSIQWH